MSVIRADDVAHEDLEEGAEVAEDGATEDGATEVKVQYVFTITDGGFAKRTRISEYRTQSRGGLGIKAMSLANEERGVLVGAFIVEDGDEVMSITQGGQVVRSRIDDNFRVLGRSTMGVKFVTPKEGDAVAVVARSVEAKVEEELEGEAVNGDVPEDAPEDASEAPESGTESENAEVDATIDGDDASE
jgi:DNA gyrase subunit A